MFGGVYNINVSGRINAPSITIILFGRHTIVQGESRTMEITDITTDGEAVTVC